MSAVEICLKCKLSDCDENSLECFLHLNIYKAQIKYSKTPKGRAANRRGAKAYYERNKEKIRAQQKRYRDGKQLVLRKMA